MGVIYLFEYYGYSKTGLGTSLPGAVVSGTYVISLKNNVSLESFANFVEKSGILVTQKFRFASGSILTIVIPENKTVGDLKQIFDQLKVNKSQDGTEDMPITNVTEVCGLIRKHCSVQNCEPQVEGAPARPGI